MYSTESRFKAMVLMAVMWLVALALTAPFLAIAYTRREYHYVEKAEVDVCTSRLEHVWQYGYIIARFIVVFVIPMCLLVFLYSRIIVKVAVDTMDCRQMTDRARLRASARASSSSSCSSASSSSSSPACSPSASWRCTACTSRRTSAPRRTSTSCTSVASCCMSTAPATPSSTTWPPLNSAAPLRACCTAWAVVCASSRAESRRRRTAHYAGLRSRTTPPSTGTRAHGHRLTRGLEDSAHGALHAGVT
ncbi:hypothetical protein C0Q70_09607 [Pomacea canaliculata]|uniref:G-protein coupled receptors family 1 profile domain-containing protein n=1 Tax=Pomacea canaliculata TaxID=400727 RepID=A0A2T7PAA1_POMCA|nr:hypothetical protein C0Q70_09607 [Pomacea canaliculata]